MNREEFYNHLQEKSIELYNDLIKGHFTDPYEKDNLLFSIFAFPEFKTEPYRSNILETWIAQYRGYVDGYFLMSRKFAEENCFSKENNRLTEHLIAMLTLYDATFTYDFYYLDNRHRPEQDGNLHNEILESVEYHNNLRALEDTSVTTNLTEIIGNLPDTQANLLHVVVKYITTTMIHNGYWTIVEGPFSIDYQTEFNLLNQMKEIATYIEQDGIEYTFCIRSEWKEIEDDTFQLLRKKYIDASEQLEAYICNYINNTTTLE